MEIRVGDMVQMKKEHPCKNNLFLVTRVGVDFKLRCQKCGRELMAPRLKIMKSIKKVLPQEEG